MCSAIQPYLYEPLRPGPESIRLLRILPSEDEIAAIECELFHCSLQELGIGVSPYDALSYVWGSSDITQIIRMGQRELPVTLNLYAALTRLRHRLIERIIWIDAVCINLQDQQERGQTIRLMAKIFGQANHVIVWLGEAADNSVQALEEIRLAGGNMATYSPNKYANGNAVCALLQRSWFQRIWVREQTLDKICIDN
jgi:hypothetical protein